MKLINAIVVDDEYFNRDLITKFVLKTNSNYQIIGSSENIDEAFKLINELKPDLLFLDIKMTGGSGFDLLKMFDNPFFEVVFVTGFDEFAIQAFEFNALDYVLKPIDIDKLDITLKKVYERIIAKQSYTKQLTQAINSYSNDYTQINKIPIHYNNEVRLIDLNTIIFIKAEDSFTIIKTSENMQHLSSKRFSDFDFILENNILFCKLNKGVFVNLNFIKSYTKGQECEVRLEDDTIFNVSRRKKTEVLAILSKER